MIKVDHIEVWGFEHAIRGMRNPYDSWDKSDSDCHNVEQCSECEHYLEDCHNHILDGGKCFHVGDNDLLLMQKLFKGGTEHRKYLRQIVVSMDITAPFYWWKEFDTYKVGTVANSCSTMHTIAKKEFTLDDFSCEHLNTSSKTWLEKTLVLLNTFRECYLSTHNKDDWWQLIQLLPTSYNQKRTVTMNYENVFTIMRQRKGHRLDEWHTLCDILKELPYVKEIGGTEDV